MTDEYASAPVTIVTLARSGKTTIKVKVTAEDGVANATYDYNGQ